MIPLEQQPWNLSEAELVGLDKAHLWHPFTQMQDWCAESFHPIVITEGRGARLRDIRGREYIDGNASIWTNIHGHNQPRLNAAIRDQLDRVAHTSFLGFTHPAAAVLAGELVRRAPGETLTRVFFSDDGSTANEVSLRMAQQYRHQRGERHRTRFLAFEAAYHGDTAGAATLGGIDLFKPRQQLGAFEVQRVSSMEDVHALDPSTINAAIIEPLIRGPAAMRPWPKGMLRELADWCREHDVLLILDEVMTGFGRTGTMFACEQEGVVPDFLNLAKGLTGGYLPMAATLTTDRVFEAFLGGRERTFYYGHSYTANPLACAAALASLALFDETRLLEGMPAKIALLAEKLAEVRAHPAVLETRQVGFAAAVELRGIDEATTTAADAHRLGAQLCFEAAEFGLLTRPIGNSVILMLPLCAEAPEIEQTFAAITAVLSRWTHQ